MNINDHLEALLDRREDYEVAASYYHGNSHDIWRNVRLARLLKATSKHVALNFCRAIVDAPLDRIEIANVLGSKQRTTKIIEGIWKQEDLMVQMNQIHKTALIYGEAFAIVWPVDGEWAISSNSPMTTAAVYSEDDPRQMEYAFKVWEIPGALGAPRGHRRTIYYPDVIVKQYTDAASLSKATEWTTISSEDNEFGEIPVFHFRTDIDTPLPEHYDAYDAQDAINEHLSEQLATSMFQSFPQRWALSATDDSAEPEEADETETKREQHNTWNASPGSVWDMTGYSQVGQFTPADPEVFWKPIMNLVRAVASITNTPLHYFERTGNVPSGQALRAAEAPLMKKIRDRQLMFGVTWRAVFRFILRAENTDDTIFIKWENHESIDVSEKWDIAVKMINAGMSRAYVAREVGLTEEEIRQVQAEVLREKEIYVDRQNEKPTNARTSTEDNQKIERENNTEKVVDTDD